MDLSTSNNKLMDMQNRFGFSLGNPVCNMEETFEETDDKGNNNMFNSLKTETNSYHAHKTSSLFEGSFTKEKELEVNNSLFSYSSFKKAMDLRTHNRTQDGGKRTIFEDAEYFAKNFCYKLLPITLEQVDETIIQVEHNYSLSSLNSGSESEEDCSRTMDYSQIREKNYKRRRTKLQEEMMEDLSFGGDRKSEDETSEMCIYQNEDFPTGDPLRKFPFIFNEENSVQPLDLSAPSTVQEEKTDNHLREHPNSIVGNDEIAQPDSDKENVNSEMNGIRVTITRPDEKDNYQPCDLFLNDIARLVPLLIDKDCFEVDILDRTGDCNDEFRNHRLYYVISEATWRLFQGTNERVILTNDQSLGQPLVKVDKDEKPSYLIFDQFSLAKCLADYCKEIGGCFEYTCVQEENNEEQLKREVKSIRDVVEEVDDGVEKVSRVDEAEKEAKNIEDAEVRQQKTEEEQQRIEEDQERMAEDGLIKTDEVERRIEKEEEELQRIGEDQGRIAEEDQHEMVVEKDQEKMVEEELQRIEEDQDRVVEEDQHKMLEEDQNKMVEDQDKVAVENDQEKMVEEELQRIEEDQQKIVEEDQDRMVKNQDKVVVENDQEKMVEGELQRIEEDHDRVVEDQDKVVTGNDQVEGELQRIEDQDRVVEDQDRMVVENDQEKMVEEKPKTDEEKKQGMMEELQKVDEEKQLEIVEEKKPRVIEERKLKVYIERYQERSAEGQKSITEKKQKKTDEGKQQGTNKHLETCPKTVERENRKGNKIKELSRNNQRLEKEEEEKNEKTIEKKRVVNSNQKQGKEVTAASKNSKKIEKNSKLRRKSPIQPEPNIPRITTRRSKSTSVPETSQKSDEPVRNKRKAPNLPEVSSNKRTKLLENPKTEDLRIKTRSGRVLEEVKANKPTAPERKNSEGMKKEKGKKDAVVVQRWLRSHGERPQELEKAGYFKTKTKKR